MVGESRNRRLRSTSPDCRSERSSAASAAGTSPARSTSAETSFSRTGSSSGYDNAARSRDGPPPPSALVSDGGSSTSTERDTTCGSCWPTLNTFRAGPAGARPGESVRMGRSHGFMSGGRNFVRSPVRSVIKVVHGGGTHSGQAQAERFGSVLLPHAEDVPRRVGQHGPGDAGHGLLVDDRGAEAHQAVHLAL